MEELLSDIVHIGALTIVAIFIFTIISGRIMYRKIRKGEIKPKTLIEITAASMLKELHHSGYTEWGFGKLDSLVSIDRYIEKKQEIYGKEDLIKDKELILRLGCFFGELLRMKKHFNWQFSADSVPCLIRNKKIIYPFELIKRKITGELESLYEYSKGL